MVSFDDPPAFKAKGEFIKSMGLRGFNLWEAGGDYKDLLLDSIRSGAGFAKPTHKDPVPGGTTYTGPTKPY